MSGSKIKVVIVGASPLSYFLATAFDQAVGNLVQTELTWLTPDPGVVHLPTVGGLLDPQSHRLPVPKFNDLKVKRSTIKSINLPAQRLVTTSGVIEFDELIIDQIPSYTPQELSAIRVQLVTLLNGLQARSRLKKPPVTARVYCQGKTAETWQLALLLYRDIRQYYPALSSSVKILVELPGNHIGDFLRRNGLAQATPGNLKLAGLTIKPPASTLPNRLIRGLKIGRDGRALVTAAMSPQGFPDVTIFDSTQLERVNLLRVFRSLATGLATELSERIDGRDRATIEVASPALVLRGHHGSYLLLGELENRSYRAQVVAHYDRRLRQTLARDS